MGQGFNVISGTEQSNPELAASAWRLQATSYLELGFVEEGALDDDGFLVADVDHARGPNVHYFVAVDLASNQPVASVRRVLPLDDNIESLPACRIVERCIDQPVSEYLETAGVGPNLVEVAGLSSAAGGDLQAIRALLRAFIHDGASRQESWLMTVVRSTFRFLQREYGATNFVEISTPQTIADPGVSEGVQLVPSLSSSSGFIRRLAADAERGRNHTSSRQLESLAFLMVGLDRHRAQHLVVGDEQSDDVNQTLTA